MRPISLLSRASHAALMIFVFAATLLSAPLKAQVNSQTVHGVVTDKVSEKPLAGVTVQVVTAGPGAGGGPAVGSTIGAVTDEMGRYTLTGVPLGRQQFSYGCAGYQPVIIPEVLVTSGKEVVLDVSLEQRYVSLRAVTVTAPVTRKGAAANEFNAGSGRSFNLDEVTRYAGGRNDPSKLVSNYAGAVANS
ncbi:MAG: carboxypeptidase regulatory-like domain-containing protein, partial [Bacteroidota bacterium]|nr:carboxypeptidase regulatory-like domain-containing protein [Bacteroidota bacterium]